MVKKILKYVLRKIFNYHSSVHKSVIIRRNVHLDPTAKVGPWVVMDGEAGFISIACGVSINAHCSLGASESNIIIGKDVRIGAGTRISCAAHIFDDVSIPIRMQGIEKNKDIIIEEDCWIGMNVSVCPGVKIGEGSVIGAGSVITKDIPPFAVAVGVPARVIRYRKDTGISLELPLTKN